MAYWRSFVSMILNVRPQALAPHTLLFATLTHAVVCLIPILALVPSQGYFERRMSWFPIERLQLERAFTTGQSERPDVVAESARIVFTTLEVIAPQFPSM